MVWGRVASLDGLRAVSISLVLIQHTVASSGSEAVRYTSEFGRLGVWIFFVISGFIITHLLLREAERGSISLKHFYFRRALRLLPALFAFLLFLAMVQWCCQDLGLRPIHFAAGAFFLVPYVPWGADAHPWSSGHLWSLAVEEHFYLLWPPLLAWLGVRHAKWPLIVFAILLPFCRVAWYKLDIDLLGSLIGLGDLMAFGALAAIWHYRQPERVQRFVRTHVALGRLVAVAAIMGIVILQMAKCLAIFTVPLGMTVVGLAVAYLLLSLCFAESESLAFRFLNLREVAWVGTISYSLYLWQQPFLHKWHEGSALWQRFPINIALAISAGIASHYLIERPFLKLKSKWK